MYHWLDCSNCHTPIRFTFVVFYYLLCPLYFLYKDPRDPTVFVNGTCFTTKFHPHLVPRPGSDHCRLAATKKFPPLPGIGLGYHHIVEVHVQRTGLVAVESDGEQIHASLAAVERSALTVVHGVCICDDLIERDVCTLRQAWHVMWQPRFKSFGNFWPSALCRPGRGSCRTNNFDRNFNIQVKS